MVRIGRTPDVIVAPNCSQYLIVHWGSISLSVSCLASLSSQLFVSADCPTLITKKNG